MPIAEPSDSTREVTLTPPASPPPVTVSRVWRDLGPLGPLALAASTLPIIGVVTLVYFRTPIAEWFRAQGTSGFGLFVGIFGLATGLALAPTHVPAIIAGYVFGFPQGGWAAMAGVLCGATIGYVIARLTAGGRLEAALSRHEKARLIFDALIHSGAARRVGLVLLLRLTTSPFALTNVVLAGARISFPTYFVCTMLGIAPRTLVAAWVGALLRDLGAHHPAERWLRIGGIVVGVLTVLIVSQIGQRTLQRAAARTNSPPPQPPP